MSCDWQSSEQNIVEPWEENTRTFANGDVRVVNLDTIEPAIGFAYLMILSPPRDSIGDRQCQVIGAAEGIGFAGFDFDSLTAGYDPAVGLVFEIVADVYDPATDTTPRRFLNFTLNQTTGEITAQISADSL